MQLDPPFCLPKVKIEMNDPVILNGNEVISMNKDYSLVARDLFKFEQMNRQIDTLISGSIPNFNLWTNSGVNIQLLCPSRDWQSGRLKLVISYRVEFIPDQVARSLSPLDDLRSQLNPE